MIQELSSGSLVTSLTITGLFLMRDLPNLTESLKRTLKRISNVLFNLVWLDLVKSTFLPRYFSLRSKRPSPWWAFLTTLLWGLVMFLLDIATSVWHEHAGHSYLRDCWKTFWGPMLFLKKKNSPVMICRRHAQPSKTQMDIMNSFIGTIHIPVVGLCSGRLTVNSLIYHWREHTLLLMFQLIRFPDCLCGQNNAFVIKRTILALQLLELASLTVYTGVTESLLVCA